MYHVTSHGHAIQGKDRGGGGGEGGREEGQGVGCGRGKRAKGAGGSEELRHEDRSILASGQTVRQGNLCQYNPLRINPLTGVVRLLM